MSVQPTRIGIGCDDPRGVWRQIDKPAETEDGHENAGHEQFLAATNGAPDGIAMSDQSRIGTAKGGVRVAF